MKKVLTAAVAAFSLLFPTFQSASAAVPKAGGMCSKKGLTQNYNNKKYTCITSGKKLVWDKGVAIKPATPTAKPTPTPTPTTSPSVSQSPSPTPNTSGSQNKLYLDPRITNLKELSDVNICKTIDLSNNQTFVRNGFPRDQSNAFGKTNVNILMLPLVYSDVNWTNQQVSEWKKTTEKSALFYNKMSYGRITMNFTFLDQKEWPVFKTKSPWAEILSPTSLINDTDFQAISNRKQAALEQVLLASSNKIDFDTYDTIVVISDAGAEAWGGTALKTSHGVAHNFVNLMGNALINGEDLLSHELGHSVFGLEDLYLQERSNFRPSIFFNQGDLSAGAPGNWDLMASGYGYQATFMGWNRLLMGFLRDSEIRCIYNQNSTIHFLNNITNSEGSKLGLINIQPGVTVAFESRSISKTNSGVLLYLIDSTIGGGAVPVSAATKLLLSGESANFAGYHFEVLETDGDGSLIQVDALGLPKKDIDLNGLSCSKLNEMVRNSNGEFWCIATSGDLRWAKNVSSSTSTPSTSPTPSPSVTISKSPEDLNGQLCSKLNEIVRNSQGEFWCMNTSGDLRWAKNNPAPTATPSASQSQTAPETTNPSPTPSPSVTASKSPEDLNGQLCTKLNEIIRNTQGEFWCMNSSGELKWAKNNPAPSTSPSPSTTPSPSTSPSSSPSPSPGPSPSSSPTTKSLEGSNCTKPGEQIILSEYMLQCWGQGRTPDGVYHLVWSKFQLPLIPTKNADKYLGKVSEGSKCDSTGDTYDFIGGYFECRFVHNSQLQWVKINNLKQSFNNTLSPNGVDVCKLQDSSVPAKTGRDTGQVAGFPFVSRDYMNYDPNKSNVHKALIFGVDFPELRGQDSVLKTRNTETKRILNEWYQFYSNGKFKLDVTSIDHWFHSPKKAKEYSIKGTYDGLSADANSMRDGITQQMLDLITNEIDLSKFQTIYMVVPHGELTLDTDWILRNRPFKIKEGTANFNFFGWGPGVEIQGSANWSFFIHETLHDFPLIGHAPGNGWPFNIMTNSSGISMAMNPWEQFRLNWLAENQIYCTEKSKLTTQNISITPLEREDKQSKMIVIKLSETKAIVIEDHGIDKWSSFNINGSSYPPGFYGIMAYIVNLADAGAPPISVLGGSIEGDNGNDPNFPRWAYFQKVDGIPSFVGRSIYAGPKTPNLYDGNVPDLNTYIAQLGDSFLIEGVRIKLVGTGDYETIEISKA